MHLHYGGRKKSVRPIHTISLVVARFVFTLFIPLLFISITFSFENSKL